MSCKVTDSQGSFLQQGRAFVHQLLHVAGSNGGIPPLCEGTLLLACGLLK